MRITNMVLTGLLLAVMTAAPAGAVTPWAFDPGVDVAPPDTTPASVYPMKQTHECLQSAVLENSQFANIPAQNAFNVKALQVFARGDHQTVAVIDSGVQPITRLPNLRPGGDYVGDSDGLQDCDHHGTLVAGIIAGQPAPADGFTGVAPGATIVSIRQTSPQYTLNVEGGPPPTPAEQSAANMSTLAKAIVHAANSGATVINLSLAACVDAGHLPDVRELGGALYYAAVAKNVVVIAAAGNTGAQTCKDNPGYDPNNPGDTRNWAGTQSVSLPSFFADFVLSVGGTTLTGEPYVHSMPGPWVGVAAPAEDIVSLDPTEPRPGALTNALVDPNSGTPGPVDGTSYAAAYISGLTALIRELHPELTAHQVIDRIKTTAHTPSASVANVLGAGVVDPLAALTAKLAPGPPVAPGIPAQPAQRYIPPPAPDTLPATITIIVIACALVVVATTFVVTLARKKGK